MSGGSMVLRRTPALPAVPADTPALLGFTSMWDIPTPADTAWSRKTAQQSPAQIAELSERINGPFKLLHFRVVCNATVDNWKKVFLRSPLGRTFSSLLQTEQHVFESFTSLHFASGNIYLLIHLRASHITSCFIILSSSPFCHILVCVCENNTGFRSTDATMKEQKRTRRNKSHH